jgi:hypothetical protein
MMLRVFSIRSLLCLLLVAAGCTVTTHPDGSSFRAHIDAGNDGGGAPLDAGKDAGNPATDSGKPPKDASTSMDDSGSGDASTDGGKPGMPARLVPALSGGGVSQSQNYTLRHTVGTFGPTSDQPTMTVPSSQHYRLGNVLIGPKP